jgi:hypothetical protein
LRALDESGRLVFAEAPGAHMQFTLEWFEEVRGQVPRVTAGVPQYCEKGTYSAASFVTCRSKATYTAECHTYFEYTCVPGRPGSWVGRDGCAFQVK